MTLVIQEDVSLAKRTTIGLGGSADQLIACKSVDDLRAGLEHAREHKLPVHILGGGSNTIFADAGWRGVVLAVQLAGVELAGDGVVAAAAGEAWDALVQQTIDAGLGGLEAMSGIPGLVGATPMQNVGAYGQQVSEVITSVEALERSSGNIVSFTNQECDFGYRSSRFKFKDARNYVITKVTYQLDPDGTPGVQYPQLAEKLKGEDLGQGAEGLMKVREATLALRRSKSMIFDPKDPNSRSCGSFFVNPVLSMARYDALVKKAVEQGIAERVPSFAAGADDKVPAALLIERAGFAKGDRRDGVGISANHPLALVNYEGTTEGLLALADEVQTKVHEIFGILLAREPVVVMPDAS